MHTYIEMVDLVLQGEVGAGYTAPVHQPYLGEAAMLGDLRMMLSRSDLRDKGREAEEISCALRAGANPLVFLILYE